MPSVCEEATFTNLFREYHQTLHNYLFYRCGNLSLAQDLTQEAFARLWKNCKSVVYATAKGYVFKVAGNLLLNTYEHQKVVLKFASQHRPEQHGEDPQFLLEERELQERLENAISNLPEKQRVVFLMSRIDAKTYQEIADFLGISKKAVEKRMYNALDSLRKISSKIR